MKSLKYEMGFHIFISTGGRDFINIGIVLQIKDVHYLRATFINMGRILSTEEAYLHIGGNLLLRKGGGLLLSKGGL